VRGQPMLVAASHGSGAEDICASRTIGRERAVRRGRTHRSLPTPERGDLPDFGTEPGGGSSQGYIATGVSQQSSPRDTPDSSIFASSRRWEEPREPAICPEQALRGRRKSELGRQVRHDPGKMIAKRVNETKREARPHRRGEVERHPGNLILPLRKVVRHDPSRARIAQTHERR